MNFAVIAPYKELADQIRQVCDELGYDIQISIGDLHEGVVEAEKLIENDNNIEVFVSRGGTAKLIGENLNIPIVPIEISTFDLIRAIDEAKDYGSKIGVVGFKNIIHGSKGLSKYLGVYIRELEIKNTEDLSQVLQDAKNEGLEVIIGDNVSSKMSEKLGIKTIRVHSGIEAIGIALRKARDLADVRRKEKVRTEQLISIVETTHEGIIASDNKGIITIVNSAAEKMLLNGKQELIGKSINNIMCNEILNKIFKERKSYLGEIFKNGSKILVQNISPVLINDEIQGIVITMNDSDYVESVETKVRKELYLKGYIAQYNFSDIITNNEGMKNLIKKGYSYAQTDLTVLIIGESGTGKEMIAQSIHNSSPRRNGPFIAINSAVMPENLLESELFGYEEGAFTGARKGGKKGLFELAHNGTLFLDEIGEMPLSLQARLLRAVQEKSIMRLGGDKVITVNTRIVAATHIDLKEAVDEGKFRRDLYYRLNVLSLSVPSLSDRKEDIPGLVNALNIKISKDLGVLTPKYTPKVLNYLSGINWLGNVRQVENIISRIAVLFSGKEITIENINEVIGTRKSNESMSKLKISIDLEELKSMEKNIIDYTMEMTNFDREKTVEILGISKTTLWRKLKE